MGQPEEKDDLVLIRETLSGSNESFGALVDRYKHPIYNLCYRMMNNKADAEDVAQDVFLRVYSKLGDFKLGFKFFSWLYTIALNVAMDALRKRKKTSFIPLGAWIDPAGRHSEIQVQDKKENAEAMLEEKESAELIFKFLGELPAKYRVPLIFKYFEGWSCEDISGLLNMPLGTVKVHLHRARALLYKKIKKNETLSGSRRILK